MVDVKTELEVHVVFASPSDPSRRLASALRISRVENDGGR
jgi:hypothetical protein